MVVVVMVRNESLLDFDSDVNDPCDEGVVKRSLFHVAGGGGGGAGDTALSGWSEGKNGFEKKLPGSDEGKPESGWS